MKKTTLYFLRAIGAIALIIQLYLLYVSELDSAKTQIAVSVIAVLFLVWPQYTTTTLKKVISAIANKIIYKNTPNDEA